MSQSVEFFGNFALEGAGRTPTLRRKRRRHPRRLTGNARHHDRRQRRGHLFSVYQEISQGRRRQRSKRFYHRCLLEVVENCYTITFSNNCRPNCSNIFNLHRQLSVPPVHQSSLSCTFLSEKKSWNGTAHEYKQNRYHDFNGSAKCWDFCVLRALRLVHSSGKILTDTWTLSFYRPTCPTSLFLQRAAWTTNNM